MRRLVRPAVVLAAAAVALIASGASAAAPGPLTLTYTDPAGDAIPTAAYDITSVTATTTGKVTTSRVNGKGKGKGKAKGDTITTYTPEALVLSMTLAAAPSSLPGTLYEIDAMTSKCGRMYLYYTPGVDGSGALVGCGSEPSATGSTATSIPVEPTVKDKTITWTLPFDALPRELKPGTSITAFEAFSTQVDPVTGVVGPYLLSSDLNFDNALSNAKYTIG